MKDFIKKAKDIFSHPAKSRGKYFASGFTLIETFVAITILMLVIVGPITLSQRSLSSTTLAKEKLSAYFLAQDGMEYVRKVRDNNKLIASQWLGFLGDIDSCLAEDIDDDMACWADTLQEEDGSPTFSLCSGGTCPLLTYDDPEEGGTGVYAYGAGDSWIFTPFERRITIIPLVPSEEELLIKVSVRWTSQGFGDQEVVLRDIVTASDF